MKTTMIRLLGNRVLIDPVNEETVSGFLIPEEYRSFRVGIVAAVGNGARLKNGQRNPIPLSVGDRVVLSDDYRMPLEIEHKQYFLVSDEKVMAVLQ
jgi:co-chaperonin GroES (HSP10)